MSLKLPDAGHGASSIGITGKRFCAWFRFFVFCFVLFCFVLFFYVGSEDLNSGPRTCTASVLLMEPFPP